jgi:putative acyl-CoA dehydrogenase
MQMGVEEGNFRGGVDQRKGGPDLRAALLYLMTQADAGTVCPMSMLYAAVTALCAEPEVAAEWEPRVSAAKYDQRFIPAQERLGPPLPWR